MFVHLFHSLYIGVGYPQIVYYATEELILCYHSLKKNQFYFLGVEGGFLYNLFCCFLSKIYYRRWMIKNHTAILLKALLEKQFRLLNDLLLRAIGEEEEEVGRGVDGRRKRRRMRRWRRR